MYGKLIDGKLIYSKSEIRENGRWYINPTPEILEELGYKKIIDTYEPREGFTFSVYYEEDQKYIYIKYNYTPIPETTPEERKQRFLEEFIITPYGSIRKQTKIGDFLAVLPNITLLAQAQGGLPENTILFYETPDFSQDVTENWLLTHQYYNKSMTVSEYMEFVTIVVTEYQKLFKEV